MAGHRGPANKHSPKFVGDPPLLRRKNCFSFSNSLLLSLLALISLGLWNIGRVVIYRAVRITGQQRSVAVRAPSGHRRATVVEHDSGEETRRIRWFVQFIVIYYQNVNFFASALCALLDSRRGNLNNFFFNIKATAYKKLGTAVNRGCIMVQRLTYDSRPPPPPSRRAGPIDKWYRIIVW